MPTMKSVQTAGPGKIEVAEIERPVPGRARVARFGGRR